MQLAEISFTLRGSLLLAAALILLGAAAAAVYYRFTLPALPPRSRRAMTALRSVSLGVLLLLFFEPVVRLTHTDVRPPSVAVLLDDSQSMALKDRAGDRAEIVRAWLSAGGPGSLPPPAVVKYYLFSSRFRDVRSPVPDSLGFGGETTDLSGALARLKELLPKENIQAAVVVTDGNANVGKNPVYAAEELGVPVYAIGVGDTAEQKDVLIAGVATNELVYANTRVPVDVVVRSSGYAGQNVEVSLLEGTKTVDRKVVQLQEGARDIPVRLTALPEEEGTQKLTVAVSAVKDELTPKNNSRSLLVKVLKSRLRILVVAGAPNPDVAAVRQLLSEDDRFSVSALVQNRGGDMAGGQLSRPAIDSADCLVLVGYPSAFSRPADVRMLAEGIAGGSKPLLFINARTTDYGKLAALDNLLPFSWVAPNPNEIMVEPSVPERAADRPLVNLDGSLTAGDWNALPPVFKTQTGFRPKPGAEVLAMARIGSVVTNEPLILVRSLNRQKSYAVAGEGLWRWRLMTQDNPKARAFLSTLYTNVVRWLATKEDDSRVRIQATKDRYTTVEPVEFTAQVYDEQLRPSDNAEVTVEVQRADGILQVHLDPVGNGRFEGSLDRLGEGEYTFHGKAVSGERVLGESRGRITVGQMNIEYIETRMNRELLEQMAERTAASYYDIGASGGISRDIASRVRLAPMELVEARELELWNWQVLVPFIVLLLCGEWFWRKRMGML